jgi:hypothetical protein
MHFLWKRSYKNSCKRVGLDGFGAAINYGGINGWDSLVVHSVYWLVYKSFADPRARIRVTCSLWPVDVIVAKALEYKKR